MIETIINGGPLMIPLLGCSIAALAALIDRYMAFRAYSKVDTRSLRAEILTLLEENRIMEAKNLCASTPGPVSAVLLVGLQSFEKLLSIKGSRACASSWPSPWKTTRSRRSTPWKRA